MRAALMATFLADPGGTLRRRSAAALIALTFGLAQAQSAGDARVALVIGNSAYASAPNVSAAKDADAMSGILRARGFVVVDARDATLPQMRSILDQARAALAGRQGVGWIYYSGYAVQLDWHNYLIPVDAAINSPTDFAHSAMDVQEIVEAFRTAGNRMNVMVLDASRDSPFTQYASGHGLAQLDAPSGTYLAFAAAPGNAVDTTNTQAGGMYAQSLAEELRRPQLKLEDAFNRTRRKVRLQSDGRQTPWESTSLEDDLFFEPGGKTRLAVARQVAEPTEMEDWERSRGTLEGVEGFIGRHPDGLLTEVANIQLQQFRRTLGIGRAEAMPQQFVIDTTRFVGEFVKDADNKTYSGTGKVVWANGDTYDGKLVRGSREGVGAFAWSNGQKYNGEWKRNQPNGVGTMEFVDGARYTGALVEGIAHGPGVYTWAGDRRLDGNWVHGVAIGIADIHYFNGDVYHGVIAADGLPEGSGKLTYASGDRYVGNFHAGTPDQEGTYTWKNGDVYKGRWRQGVKEDPQGTYTWKNGDFYKGGWKDGKKEGAAIMRWADGKEWFGTYHDNLPAEGQMGKAPEPTN